MNDTDYENGVLVCDIHRTPISKSHGRFFCVKCQRNKDIITEQESIDQNPISCPACDSNDNTVLGILGKRIHFRCRACGIDFSHKKE